MVAEDLDGLLASAASRCAACANAARVHGSGEARVPRLEEVAGWANREMVLEAVRQDRRDVRGGEGVDREVSGEEVSGG